MAISKISGLANTYRYFKIAVTSYHNKEMQGQVYHSSRDYGIRFGSLIDLVWCLDEIFETSKYPMQSMKQRRFRRIQRIVESEADEDSQSWETAEDIPKLATFQLFVKYRFHATWQGGITWLETGETFEFSSFLELIRIFDRLLVNGVEEHLAVTGNKSCRVLLDEYENRCMQGRIAQPTRAESFKFDSVIQLSNQMDEIFLPREGALEEWESLFPNTALGAYREHGKKATFVVRVLFKSHATWQGILYWREAREEARFRSFLELILLMDAAASENIGWNTDKEERVKYLDG